MKTSSVGEKKVFLLVINEFCGCFGLVFKVYCGWNWFCFGNHGRNEVNLLFSAENREWVPVPKHVFGPKAIRYWYRKRGTGTQSHFWGRMELGTGTKQ